MRLVNRNLPQVVPRGVYNLCGLCHPSMVQWRNPPSFGDCRKLDSWEKAGAAISVAPPDCAAGCSRWYEANRRDLPWRGTRDPYAIWVSEIMLQQTRVAAVVDRYRAFMARFPTVAALARAAEQEVLALWSGLGYYRRARMLHQAARSWWETSGGDAAVNRGRAASVARHWRLHRGSHRQHRAWRGGGRRGRQRGAGPLPAGGVGCIGRSREVRAPAKIGGLAAQLLDPVRPGDFNQAMMELGATVCLPRNPTMPECPLWAACATRGEHKTAPRARMRNPGCGLRALRSRGAGAQARGAAGTASRGGNGHARPVGVARVARSGCSRLTSCDDSPPRHHAGQLPGAHPHGCGAGNRALDVANRASAAGFRSAELPRMALTGPGAQGALRAHYAGRMALRMPAFAAGAPNEPSLSVVIRAAHVIAAVRCTPACSDAR